MPKRPALYSGRGRHLVLVGVLALGIGSPVRPAAAESVSAAQLRALAERARTDTGALGRLRQVDQVDGRAVDLGRAIEGAEGRVLDARLRALAGEDGRGGTVGATPGAARSRADAGRILESRRFHASRAPRPLRGALRRLGGWLRPVVEPVGRAWAAVVANLAGRLVLVTAVVGLAALTALRLIRRRTAAGVAARSKRRPSRAEDPEDLDRRADRAEREGNLDLAFRLRFRAGLVRLDRAGLVAFRPSLSNGQLTAGLRSATLGGLAGAFDEIAYGGRPAQPADLVAARSGWPRVLEEARLTVSHAGS